MVRSAFESGNPDLLPGNVKNMEDLATVTKLRILTVDEVGDALMKSFNYDKGSDFDNNYGKKCSKSQDVTFCFTGCCSLRNSPRLSAN